MRFAGWLGLVGMGIVLASACGGEDDPDGSGSGGSTPQTYGASDCGTCALSACESEVSACGADPGCAAYLECLQTCPVNAVGNVDVGCEAGCSTSASSTSEELEAALSLCRDDFAGAACSSCGVATVLDQECTAPSMETLECPRCEDERCCETRQACRDVPECVPFLDCLQACPFGAEEIPCAQQCAIDHEPGIAAFADKLTCIVAKCNAECGGDACSECVSTNCPNTYAACQADLSCYLLDKCFASCAGQDQACSEACLAQYPEGTDLFTASSLCTLEACATACGS